MDIMGTFFFTSVVFLLIFTGFNAFGFSQLFFVFTLHPIIKYSLFSIHIFIYDYYILYNMIVYNI